LSKVGSSLFAAEFEEVYYGGSFVHVEVNEILDVFGFCLWQWHLLVRFK
jgi:hypothetical protein